MSRDVMTNGALPICNPREQIIISKRSHYRELPA